MSEIRILGISIENRMNASVNVQSTLTKFGCSIKTRVGLHEVTEKQCSIKGLIILELYGDPKESDALESELKAIVGVNVQKMVF